MTNEIKLVLTADSSGAITGIRNVHGELTRLNAGAHTASGEGFGSLTRSVGLFIAQVAPLVSGMEAIRRAITMGIDYSKTLETTKLGIAAIVTSIAEIRNVAGESYQGIAKFTMAQQIAVGVQSQLQRIAMTTVSTYQELLGVYQAILAPALAAKLTMGQTAEMAGILSNSIKAIGLPLDQVVQESRDLLSGNIDNNSTLAKSLGITREMVTEWKNGNKVFDELKKRLEGFVYASQEFANTWEGAMSNLKDAAQKAFGEGFQSLFERIKKEALAMTSAITTPIKEIGSDGTERVVDVKINESVMKDIRALSDALVRLIDALKMLGIAIKWVWDMFGREIVIALMVSKFLSLTKAIVAATTATAAFSIGIKSIDSAIVALGGRLGVIGILTMGITTASYAVQGLYNHFIEIPKAIDRIKTEVPSMMGVSRDVISDMIKDIQMQIDGITIDDIIKGLKEGSITIRQLTGQDNADTAIDMEGNVYISKVTIDKEALKKALGQGSTPEITLKAKIDIEKLEADLKKLATEHKTNLDQIMGDSVIGQANAEASANIRKARAESVYGREAALIKNNEQRLDEFYQRGLLMASDYYAQKDRLAEKSANNEISKAQKVANAEKATIDAQIGNLNAQKAEAQRYYDAIVKARVKAVADYDATPGATATDKEQFMKTDKMMEILKNEAEAKKGILQIEGQIIGLAGKRKVIDIEIASVIERQKIALQGIMEQSGFKAMFEDVEKKRAQQAELNKATSEQLELDKQIAELSGNMVEADRLSLELIKARSQTRKDELQGQINSITVMEQAIQGMRARASEEGASAEIIALASAARNALPWMEKVKKLYNTMLDKEDSRASAEGLATELEQQLKRTKALTDVQIAAKTAEEELNTEQQRSAELMGNWNKLADLKSQRYIILNEKAEIETSLKIKQLEKEKSMLAIGDERIVQIEKEIDYLTQLLEIRKANNNLESDQSFTGGISRGIADYTKTLELNYEKGRQLTMSFAQNIEDALVKAFDNPKEALKDLGTMFLNTIKRMMIQAIANPIIVPIAGMMSGIAGSVGGGLQGGGGGWLGGLMNTGILGNTTLGSLLGMGAMGYGIGGIGGGIGSIGGSLLGDLAGLNAYNVSGLFGDITEGFFDFLGSTIPLIGPIIGTLLGSLLGDLFEGKPDLPEFAMWANAPGGQTQGAYGDGDWSKYGIGTYGFGMQELGMNSGTMQQITRLFQSTADKVKDILSDMGLSIEGFTKEWYKGLGDIENMTKEQLEATIKAYIAEYVQFASGIDFSQWQKGGEDLIETINRILQAFKDLPKAITSVDRYINAINNQDDSVAQYYDQLASYGDKFDELWDTFNSTTDPADQLAALNQIKQAIYERYQMERDMVMSLVNAIKAVEAEIASFTVDMMNRVGTLSGNYAGTIEALRGYGTQAWQGYQTSTDPDEKWGYLQQMISYVDQMMNAMIAQIQAAYAAQKEAIQNQIDDLNEQKEAIQDAMQAQVDALNAQKQAIQDQIDVINEHIDALNDEKEAIQERIDAVQLQIDALNEEREAVQERIDALNDQKDAIAEQTEAIQEQLNALGDWKSVLDSVNAQILGMRMESSNPQNVMERLNVAKSEVDRIRALYESESDPSKKAGYATQLQAAIQRYIEAAQGAFQRPSPQYQDIYDQMIELLGMIQGDATGYASEQERLLSELERLQKEANAIDELIKEETRKIALIDDEIKVHQKQIVEIQKEITVIDNQIKEYNREIRDLQKEMVPIDKEIARLQQEATDATKAIDEQIESLQEQSAALDAQMNAEIQAVKDQAAAWYSWAMGEGQQLEQERLNRLRDELNTITGGMDWRAYLAQRQAEAVEELINVRNILTWILQGLQGAQTPAEPPVTPPGDDEEDDGDPWVPPPDEPPGLGGSILTRMGAMAMGSVRGASPQVSLNATINVGSGGTGTVDGKKLAREFEKYIIDSVNSGKLRPVIQDAANRKN